MAVLISHRIEGEDDLQRGRGQIGDSGGIAELRRFS